MSRDPSEGPARAKRSRFHLLMALAMLGFVVLGFTRTFFLRPLFETYDVPGYALAHGVAMTLWFVWYVIQTALAMRGRLAQHRRMGYGGVAIGALAIVSSFGTGLGLVTRNRLAGRDIEAELAHFADVVWTNMSSIIVFTGFFILAIALRRRPGAHKRLMVLASMSLMGPALSRIGILSSVEVWPGMELNRLVFEIGAMAALASTLVLHDVVTTRRIHHVTLLGIPALFGGLKLLSVVVPGTALGQGLIRLL